MKLLQTSGQVKNNKNVFNEGRHLSEFKQLNFTNDTKDVFLQIVTKSEAKEHDKYKTKTSKLK